MPQSELLYQFATLILDSAVKVLYAALPIMAFYLASKARAWLEARTTAELARIAVQAAEQLYKTGRVDDRLDYAMNWLSDTLRARGLIVPVDELRAVVESAVYSGTHPRNGEK